MAQKFHRIKRADITFLSLCPRGKNGMSVLYKADDGSFQLDMIVKAPSDFDEKGLIYGVVYAPELPDADRHMATADEIQKMSHSWMRNGGKIDIRHDQEAVGIDKAYPVENFIIQKGDPRFQDVEIDGQAVDVTGGWAVGIQIDDPFLRKEYREGRWGGLSMFGTAELEEVSKGHDDLDYAASRIIGAMADRTATAIATGEIEMNEEQFMALLAKNNETLATAIGASISKALEPIAKAVTPAEPPADPKPEAASGFDLKTPVFKGSIADPKAVQDFAKEMEIHNLAKAVDWTSADSIREFQAAIAKEETPELKEARENLAKAQERIAELQGRSTTVVTKEDSTIVENTGGDLKESMELAKAMADYANKGRVPSNAGA